MTQEDRWGEGGGVVFYALFTFLGGQGRRNCSDDAFSRRMPPERRKILCVLSLTLAPIKRILSNFI